MKIEHTNYATAHVNATRRRSKAATWADVANAYDAGLVQGVNTNGPKRETLARYMRALRIINAANVGRNP